MGNIVEELIRNRGEIILTKKNYSNLEFYVNGAENKHHTLNDSEYGFSGKIDRKALLSPIPVKISKIQEAGSQSPKKQDNGQIKGQSKRQILNKSISQDSFQTKKPVATELEDYNKSNLPVPVV